MTGMHGRRKLFSEWYEEMDCDVACQGRKMLLLLDNCTTHLVMLLIQVVVLLFLLPNVTHR